MKHLTIGNHYHTVWQPQLTLDVGANLCKNNSWQVCQTVNIATQISEGSH